MIAIDPQQELFTRLKLDIEALGYDVYDGALPPEGTKYPFVYMGDFSQNDSNIKNNSIGTVLPTIHVWHSSPKKRGDVSAMLLNIKRVCLSVERTKHYKWLIKNVSTQIMADSTVKPPLLHGVVEAECLFS